MNKPTKLIICLALIGGAIIGAMVLIKTAPEAQKNRPPKRATLIDTVALVASNETVVLSLTGTVVPAQEIMLRARVSGQIVAIAPEFIDGGILQKDEPVLTIDPTDFELALTNAESAVKKAEFDYKLEMGRQDVAKREWALLGVDDATETEKELALRLPHLRSSKAALESAEASLERARLNLSRTQILAPFNAIVLDRQVNVGSQASESLAKLVGTDRYWVQASIPVDQLRWITIPGSTATLVSASGAKHPGSVIKLLGNLEEKGRMARILIEVADPLCLKPENAGKVPLLLGEFVRAEVSGRELNGVYRIPRNALHEDKQIWIAAPDNTLDIRQVSVLWRGKSSALIADGPNEGELLVISDITTPMQGLALSTGNDEPTKGAEKGKGKKGKKTPPSE